MRIGLFIDTFNLGGAEIMVFELALLLKKQGYHPVLLHFGSEYIDAFCSENKLEHYCLPNRKEYKKTLLLPFFAVKTRSFIKKLKLDCVHSHLYGPIVAMGLTCFLARVPHIGTLHDEYTIEERPSRIKLLKLVVSLGTKLIAVSTPMRKFYVNRGGFSEKVLKCVPNFSPTPNANELAHVTSLRSDFSLSEDTFVVLGVGRLVELKQFEHLVAAMKLVPEGAHLFIAGQGPEEQSIRSKIEELGLQARVTLLGERNDLSSLLAQADVFALVSRTEGMSRSILEAMGLGLPIVATDVGGNSDLVENNVNGFLVESGNIEQIAKALSLLVQSQELTQRLGAQSLLKAQNKFSAERFIESHIQLYR